jgi:hypothetical protein
MTLPDHLRRTHSLTVNLTLEEHDDLVREAMRLRIKPTKLARIAVVRSLNPRLRDTRPFEHVDLPAKPALHG